MSRIDRWEYTRNSAIREAQEARFQERQHRLPIERLEWPESPPTETWRDRMAGIGLLAQILWWLVTGKLFNAV